VFGIVALNVRKKTGSAISCSAERNEELRFFVQESVWLEEGSSGRVIEMKKGPDDGIVLQNEAVALYDLGNYRDALAKLKPALVASQRNGDDAEVVDFHLMMISCYAALREVSLRSSWRGFEEKADESLSHSTQTRCASATSWSRY
jgi:hypothetical protein